MPLAAALLLPAPVLLVAAYRLFFHPLSGVPGPRLAAVSRLWYAYHVRHGRMLQLAQTLHKTYGPAVRVAPNEVWFDSEDAFKMIYSAGHGFEKSDFYLTTALFRPQTDWRHPLQLAFPDTLDLLSERDAQRYRLQRRLIGPVYHASNIQKFGSAVDAVLERVVAELRAVNGAEVDLKMWMHIVAVECLGATVLSWSPGFVKDRSDFETSRVGYLNWRRKSVFGLFPLLVVADLHMRWIGRLFASVWNLGYRAGDGYKPFFPAVGNRVSSRIRQARKAAAAAAAVTTETEPGRRPRLAGRRQNRDLMADLVDLHHARPALNETYLRRLAVTNFGAGHETMCSALTAAVAMIGSHPDVLRRVADEVRGRQDCSEETASARNAAEYLPFTTSSIKEAQRLHPAIGMSLPRTVPQQTTATGRTEWTQLHGHRLPPGTIVGCSPPALHRNPAIFGSDADAFRPERWLECDAQQRRAMERFNLTWGGGSRTCPGRYLAELVVYKTLVALVQAFDIEATMPADKQIQYYFLAMLTGAKARFLPWEERQEQQETKKQAGR